MAHTDTPSSPPAARPTVSPPLPPSPPGPVSDRHLLSPVKANWWLPVVLVLLVPLGWWIEGGQRFAGVTWDPFWGRIVILVGINLTLAVSLQLINGIAGQFSLGHAGFMAVGAYAGGYAVTTFGDGPVAAGDTLPWMNPGGVAVFLLAFLVCVAAGGAILWAAAKAVALTGKIHTRLPGVLVWGLLAYVAADLFVSSGQAVGSGGLGATAGISAGCDAAAAAFQKLLALGTPAGAAVSGWVPEAVRKPVTLLVALLGGGVFAAVAGLVVGLPTLRLRGDYLAIATLGTAELIATAISNLEPLGRATGLSVPGYAAPADPELHLPATHILPWVYAVAIVATLAVWRIQRSPKGRALECLREDEIAAGAVGINVTEHKVLAFVVGAFLAGTAGVLFAHYDGYLNPKQFGLQRSIELVVIVTLGGLGSIPGTIVACVLLSLLQPVLQTASQWLPTGTPKSVLELADSANKYRLVIYAVLLVVAMVGRGNGWFGLAGLWRRVRGGKGTGGSGGNSGRGAGGTARGMAGGGAA